MSELQNVSLYLCYPPKQLFVSPRDYCQAVSESTVYLKPEDREKNLRFITDKPVTAPSISFNRQEILLEPLNSPPRVLFEFPVSFLAEQVEKQGTVEIAFQSQALQKTWRLALATGFVIREITPLQERIARDLQNGNPLVIQIELSLWDKRFGPPYQDGTNLKRNIFWGAKYGAFTMFKKSKDWNLVFYEEKEDLEYPIAATAIFKSNPVAPAGVFAEMGVQEKFNLYVIFNVYRYYNLHRAYRNLAINLFEIKSQKGFEEEEIHLPDGQFLCAGSQSHVLGYTGHLSSDGLEAFSQVKDLYNSGSLPVTLDNKGKRKMLQPKGFFAVCCQSYFLANVGADPNVYQLLFSTDFMSPEAYTHLALINAIANGKDGKDILSASTKAYVKYHPRGGKVFTGGCDPRMKKYWGLAKGWDLIRGGLGAPVIISR